jgi:hypothetical protein
MPRPLDLTGRRFGRSVARLLLDKRGKHGWRLWQCYCDCGKAFVTSVAKLRSGDARSCGCGRYGQEKQIITQNGEDWYVLRKACRYVKKSRTTLTIWAGLNKKGPRKGCHWLGGAFIETRFFDDAVTPYFRKKQLDDILTKMAARQSAPEYVGLVPIRQLVKETDMRVGSVRRIYLKWSATNGIPPVVKRKHGRSDAEGDGRALTRSYLAKRFATWFRERYTPEIPRDEDDVTVREAAALLRRYVLTVYAYIRDGQLHVKPDRTTIPCRAGYPREGLVLSRKEVQELRQKLLAKHGPVATRARKIHAVAVLRELLEDGQPHLRIEVVDAALRKGVGHREIHYAKKA